LSPGGGRATAGRKPRVKPREASPAPEAKQGKCQRLWMRLLRSNQGYWILAGIIKRLIIVFTLSFRRRPESSGFLDAGSSPA